MFFINNCLPFFNYICPTYILYILWIDVIIITIIITTEGTVHSISNDCHIDGRSKLKFLVCCGRNLKLIGIIQSITGCYINSAPIFLIPNERSYERSFSNTSTNKGLPPCFLKQKSFYYTQ
jgi:hypothetical protein